MVSWASPRPPALPWTRIDGQAAFRPFRRRTPTASTASRSSRTTRASTACAPDRLLLHGHRRQRRARRGAVRGQLPHGAAGARAVSLDQLRRPGHAEHPVGAVVPAERVRGAGGRAVPAAVSPAERRSLLREPESDAQPAVWADFGNNNQASAALRPWMPCPGNHEVEFDNGPQGFTSYLTRYTCRTTARPGSAAAGTASGSGRRCSSRCTPTTSSTRTAPRSSAVRRRSFRRPGPGTRPSPRARRSTSAATRAVRRHAGCAARCATARRDDSIDWIIVQMHQDALSRRRPATGRTLGSAETWLPLFDRVRGRPGPVRSRPRLRAQLPGARLQQHVGQRPRPGHRSRRTARTPSPPPTPARFDTSQGTVHLILGGGGTRRPWTSTASTRRRAPPGQGVHQAEPARADATAGIFARPAGRGRGRDLVCAARHRHGLRDRGVRSRPGRGGRQDQDHGQLLPRAGRGPGEPDQRGEGRRRRTTPSSRRSPWSGRVPTRGARAPAAPPRWLARRPPGRGRPGEAPAGWAPAGRGARVGAADRRVDRGRFSGPMP